MATVTKIDLMHRIRQLEERLEEAEETLRALRSGEVDAILVSGPDGEQVYTLKGADEAYRIMVENMAEGALTVGLDGVILFSNQQFASMLGIPLERVIGSSVRDFIAADDAFVLSALLASPRRAEGQLRLKKGSAALLSVHISANTLLLDGIECVCFIITDLTEQKRNQEIVAAERLARSILDQSAGAILVVDPTGKIVRASRGSEQMAKSPVLLRQFDEVYSLRINSDAITDGIALNYRFEQILSAVQRLGTVADVEATVSLPDGQTLDAIVSAALLTGTNSECLGCIVLISDVSSLKRAEQEIRQLNAELEQRVHSRTAALEAANKELEAFAYSVAHDLHSPLRGIDSWSLALLENYGANLDLRGRDFLDRVRAEAQHMARLIDGLLQLSRMGQAEMVLRTVDLTALAQAISTQLRLRHADRHLEFHIEPGLSAIGDAALLETALTNLLDNAVKFTFPAPQSRIEFGKDETRGECAFFVRDNGVGFDMRNSGTLFGTFQRLHPTSDFPGIGVGLAIVKRIVERHGGKVWAEAQVGHGASFYFTLGDT